MNKIKICIGILLVGYAHANPIEVELQSEESQTVPSGKVVTASFLIKNRDKGKNFISSLKLPEGWSTISLEETSFYIEENESDLQCVAIKIPPKALAGIYYLSYSIEGEEDPESRDKRDFIVHVPPHKEFKMFVNRPPKYLTANSPYEFEVTLYNQGNVEISIDLKILSNLNYPLKFPHKVTLLPGESRQVPVKIKIPYGVEKSAQHYVTIRATGEDDEKSAVYETVQTEIFPPTQPSAEQYRTLAMKTLFGYGMKGEKKQLFIDQYGKGTIDEAQKRNIDFFFRLPVLEQTNADLYLGGPQGKYYLHYWDQVADMYGGYGIYKMTPLLMNARFGKGGSLAINPGPIRISGLFIRDTSSTPQQIYGGDFSYFYKEYLTLTASSINTTYPKKTEKILDAQHNSTTSSLFGNARYKNKTNTTLECATVGTPFHSSEGRSAYYFYSRGSPFKSVWYGLQKIHAGPQFVGYYRDTNQLYASLGFPIVKRLRGTCAYNEFESNLDSQTAKRTAPRNHTYYGGLSCSFPFGLYSSLYYNNLHAYDALQKKGYATQYLSLTGAQTFSKTSFQGMIDCGKLHPTGISSDSGRYWETVQFNAYYRVTPRQQYSLYTRLGHSSFSSQSQWTQTYGAAANCQFFDRFRMNLIYERSEHKSYSNYFNADLAYTRPNKHQVALKGHWSQSKDYPHKTEFLLSYTIPWSLPIGKNRSKGSIRGALLFEDSENCASNLIVTCDKQRTLTNEKGEFVIANLTPGIHLLQVEERAGALVPVTPLPLEVAVVGGEIAESTVRFQEPATLEGHIELYDLINEVLVDQGVWEKVTATLESASHRDKLFAVSDGNGVFSFDKIPPGRWILKFFAHNAPLYHFLEDKEVSVDVFPGDEKKVEVRLLPINRKVRMIDSGEI